jgi:hypothetical protein
MLLAAAPRLAGGAAMLLAAACDGGERVPAAAVRDSAGVAIVEHAAIDSAAIPWLRLDASRTRRLGAAEGESGVMLFQVRSAARLSDGGVVAANGGSSELIYFGPDGEHVVTAGRNGGGPGEFQQLGGVLVLPGDSVAVYDPAANRVSVFDRGGRFVREFAPSGETRVAVVGRFGDGSYVGTTGAQVPPGELQNGLMRRDVVYVRFREPVADRGDGNTESVAISPPGLDTLGVYPSDDRFLRMTQSGGQLTSIELISPPFGRSTGVVTADDVMYVGTQDGPDVIAIEPSGVVVRLIRTDASPVAVTPSLLERWIDIRVQTVPPERQPALRQTYASIEMPSLLPTYGAIAAAADGTLWVQDYTGAGAPNDWTLYGPDGQRQARLRLPERFRVMGVGEDWVLGVELDELDVETIRIYSFGPVD